MAQSIRSGILERDHYICQSCGRQAGQVHHITPRSQGGGNDPKNLVTLCGRCHMLISPIPPKALWGAFRIPEGEIEIEREKVLKALAKFHVDNIKI